MTLTPEQFAELYLNEPDYLILRASHEALRAERDALRARVAVLEEALEDVRPAFQHSDADCPGRIRAPKPGACNCSSGYRHRLIDSVLKAPQPGAQPYTTRAMLALANDALCARVAALEAALREAKGIAKGVAGECEECGEPATGFAVETNPLNDGEPVVATSCDAHPVGDREEYPFAGAIRAINAALAGAKTGET